MSLYHELKHRNVLRVAIAYLAGSWLLVEVAETIFPLFGFDDTPARILVIVLAIGFPLFLLFSWVFEITPQGLKKEKDIDRTASVTHKTGKQLDRIIIVLLALALGYFAFDKFVLEPARVSDLVEETAQQARSEVLVESYGNKSIAVLPFVNMSSDLEQEYFSDGLTDTLIHGLAQVSGLRVTAKTSSFYFKGMNVDIREIARKLNVSNILEGSVQKSGNRVRITAQLIEANSDTHLWSKSFDRELEDIFAVQDEIAQEVVRALEVTLLDTEEERLAQRYQPSLEAYEQLILGRHEMAKRTTTSLSAAEQHFKQAIELDPEYALAYVNLSQTYGLQWRNSGLVIEESLQRRQPLIEQALELDPLLGEAYVARASLHRDQYLKTGEGASIPVDEDILKALELSPNYALAHSWYSGLLNGRGRFEEALEQSRLAAELDPMSQISQTALASATWNTGRVEEALALFRHNIERNPGFPDNYGLMAGYQVQLGHLGEAQRWFREVRRRNPGDQYYWWAECVGFLRLFDLLSAEDCGKQFSEAFPENLLPQVVQAALYHHKGEWKTAVVTVESLKERLPGWGAYTRWLADLIAQQGDFEHARRLMADYYAELLENDLKLSTRDYYLFGDYYLAGVMTFAAILYANGETQQGDLLLQALEECIATMHRIHGVGYGIIDVYIHAIRGDHDQAITALREAINMGWKGGNWVFAQDLYQDWKLANLHQDPEFIALMDELEADVRKQRQWYEENKDKPLF